MSITVQEIKDLKKYYTEKLYPSVRLEQNTDQTYIDDTFPVPEVRSPHKIYRSGIGYRIVNIPSEQIVTSNPQLFVRMGKDTKGMEEAGLRLSKEGNSWIEVMRRQNPNPFKEFVKNPFGRGEAYIKLCHNENWVDNPIGKDKEGNKIYDTSAPFVSFVIPDPMVIYGSPEEDVDGCPLKVIVFYERQCRDLILRYPFWKPRKTRGEKEKVEWIEYWDGSKRYIEADEVPITDGIEPNLYGFTPFIRRYSGFGKRSPDGNLASLIFSDIRMSRDLILEECVTRSNLNSIEFLFAHRGMTILHESELGDEAIEQLKKQGAYDVRDITVPDITKIKIEKDEVHEPPAEMYAHLTKVHSELAQMHPCLVFGSAFGNSARQDDLAWVTTMRRYDTVIENTNSAFATAFERAFKICDAIPGVELEYAKPSDLKTDFKCEIRLKAPDPVEEDRKSTLGSRLLLNSEIDPITNLTEFKGYTEERANKVMVDILKWKVLNAPAIAQFIGMKAAERAGMLEEMQSLQEEASAMTELSPTEEQRAMGEGQTLEGQVPQPAVGSRFPPEAYTRGGGV